VQIDRAQEAAVEHDRAVPTRLLFVRHGESVHSVEGFIGGPRTCRGLTGRGHDQARAVARWLAVELRTTRPIAVYSSTLRRATETATTIAAALAVPSDQDCRLCTWHVPDYADGLTQAQLREHAVTGGGVYRPFERDSETWAELVVRGSQAVLDIAERHEGSTAIIVGHSETVEVSFHALGLLPLYRSFDLTVAPASITEWHTDETPTAWPPPRWTLTRFNQTAESRRRVSGSGAE
jgi:2,3-bisphosphoglycerate-dependent phosphoglycerate mutase